MLQLSDADPSMLQCTADFKIPFINAHFVADNASHALASSATVKPTFNDEEKVVVIRNGWTPKKISVEIQIANNTAAKHVLTKKFLYQLKFIKLTVLSALVLWLARWLCDPHVSGLNPVLMFRAMISLEK